MPVESSEYHEVFLPLPDVYLLGGTDVFQALERKKGQGQQKNLVVVPFQFLNELDGLKNQPYSYGAVEVLEYITQLMAPEQKSGKPNLKGTLCPALDGLDILVQNEDIRLASRNKGLESISLDIKDTLNSNLIVITNNDLDIIRHRMRGIKVEEPEFIKVDENIVYEGVAVGEPKLLKKLKSSNGSIPLKTASNLMKEQLFYNKFVVFQTGEDTYEYARVIGDLVYNPHRTRIIGVKNERLQLIGRWQKDNRPALMIGNYKYPHNNVLGICPRDVEQHIALQHNLLDPNITHFFLCGSQGSGKTLLSYIAAVDLILWYDKDIRKLRMPGRSEGEKGGFFSHIILLKPTEILGGKRRDPGALPGTLFDKIEDHLGSYKDAHRESYLRDMLPFEQMILDPKFDTKYGPKRSGNASSDQLGAHLPPDIEAIEVEHSGFIGGRSLKDTFLVVDEAQNFTPFEMKTILSRLGEGCKSVIMGDPAQVYNPFCTREINGLTFSIKYYLGKKYTGLVTLSRNYRSQTSEDADQMKVHS